MPASGRLLWGRKMASPDAAAPLVQRLARPIVAGDHRGRARRRCSPRWCRARDRLAQPPENRDRIVVKHGHQHEQRSVVARGRFWGKSEESEKSDAISIAFGGFRLRHNHLKARLCDISVYLTHTCAYQHSGQAGDRISALCCLADPRPSFPSDALGDLVA
jgi:hypothetical protein